MSLEFKPVVLSVEDLYIELGKAIRSNDEGLVALLCHSIIGKVIFSEVE